MEFPESIKLIAKQRAHFRCVVCQEPWVDVHHIIPRAEGGLGVVDNAAPLCGSCHKKYGGNPELRKQLRQMRDWWWARCAESNDISAVAQKIDEIRVAVLEGQKKQEDALTDVKAVLVQQLKNAQQEVMAAKSVPDALAVAATVSEKPMDKLAAALMEMHRVAEEQFAGVGQWYSSLPADERKMFEQDVKRLAEIADHVALRWSLFVKARWVGSSRVDLQACKLEYSIVSPK